MSYVSLDLEKLRNDQSYSTQKVLFPHQSEAIDAMSKAFTFRDQQGKGGLLVLPTGAGKTYTSVKWLCETVLPQKAKIIWLAHSFHLLDQAYETFIQNAKWIPFPRSSMNIRIVSSNPSHCRTSEITPTDDVVIMTTPTAIGHFFREALDMAGEKLDSSFVKFLHGTKDQRLVLVLDEAHHAPAYGCRRLLAAIREMHPSAYFLGLTATPDYSDETRRGWLNKLFDQWIIYEANKNKLQSQNILAREKLIQKKTNEVLEVDDALYNKLMREHRDLPEDIVEKLASNSLRNDFIVQEYLANRKDYGKTIIFADRWFQCLYLKDKLAKAGVSVDAVYSHIDADPGSAEARNRRTIDDNHKIIRQFKNDELDVLINVRMLTEGTDVPNTRTVFVTRETTSSILLTQMIGRALRGEKAGGGPDKKDANIVFFTDTWQKVIHWASYSPDGGVEGRPPVKGYYPVEMISIRLVENLIKRINSGRSFQTEPFSSLMPIGWYQATYVSLGESEEMGSFDEFVMVYNFQEKGFQTFIQRNFGNLSEKWEKEDLSMEWAQDEIRRLADGCFNLDEDNLGETLVFDLVRIARHMAQNKAAPKFFPFEERERYDLDKIAKEFMELKPSDQWYALGKIFQQPGGLWSTFYKTFDRFKSAFDGALNRLLQRIITNRDDKEILPTPHASSPTTGSKRELTEIEKELVIKHDHYRCLCCGAEKGRAVKLQVDHILPDRMGGETSIDNSQTLCKFCNTAKGINELNFQIHRSLLTAPKKELDFFRPTNFDDFKSFMRRLVNFFYHCGAVADCRLQKREGSGVGKTLFIQLYPENNPQWLKPHLQNLLSMVRENISRCGSINSIVVEANEEHIQEDFKPTSEGGREKTENIPTIPDFDSMKEEDVRRMLVGAAEDMNKEMGLKPPIDINADTEALKKEIIKYAIDVNEDFELYQETWGTLMGLEAKLGFDYSGYIVTDESDEDDVEDEIDPVVVAKAEAGDAKAQVELGRIYFDRDEPADWKQAVIWFEKAASLENPEGELGLAKCLRQGCGISRNLRKAREHFKLAAAQGNAEAQYLLGTMFQSGEGGKKDLEEFMRWTGRAALQDHSDALNAIGVAFHNGEGVPKDFSQAMNNYRKAAELGSNWAMRNIGILYEQGQGVAHDPEAAAKWYGKAAAAGHSDACRSLALAHAKGRGVPKNLVEAYLLYSLAANLAPEGKERGAILGSRTRLAKEMPKEEVSQAEEILKEPDFFSKKMALLGGSPPAKTASPNNLAASPSP